MTSKQIERNQRYNAERKAQAELMKRDLDRDQVLAKIYQESYNRMQAQIDKFYMTYAGQNGLTKQEAMKRVSAFDVTQFNQKAAEAVRTKDFSPETNAWLKTYNLKMRVSRLELLKAELALEIQNLTAEVNEVFDKARRDEQLAEFQRQAGILGHSATGVKKRLEAILEADFYGQTFSSRVWGGLGLRATLQRDVFGSLNRIYTDMMGYQKERDRLAKKFGTSKANAQRLLKTEIARINADTQLAMLKENDFTHLIYVAESGACKICQPLDGKAIPIDDVEKGLNMYPMHPNCRCSAYGHIKMDYKAGGSTLDREAPNGVWGNKILEKEKEKAYNQGMSNSNSSGAISARRGDIKKQQDEFAERYYNQLRNSKRENIISTMSEHSGVAGDVVAKALEHILDNEYFLWDSEEFEYRMRKFYPHYDMALSLQRLMLGEGRTNDITMLKHEALEHYYMNVLKMSYDDAHKLANQEHNYEEGD